MRILSLILTGLCISFLLPNLNAQDIRGPLVDVKIKTSSGKVVTQKAEILDGYVVIDGDIIISTEEDYYKKSAAILSTSSGVWPTCKIPYTIDPTLTDLDRIHQAINHINDNTNLSIIPRTTEANYIHFQPNGFCNSFVGMVGGQQAINLSSGCQWVETVHEVMHAAGFYHEQSRADRDTWIVVNWSNIQTGASGNFNQYSSGQDIGAYDYNSIMHYRHNFFGCWDCSGTTNCDPNFVPSAGCTKLSTLQKPGGGIDFGPDFVNGMTTTDALGINTVYPTGATCLNIEITSQNTATSWTANGSNNATINWSNSGSTSSCANVNILFSTDGGSTFPYTLASNTANDGSHVITIPSYATSSGRIKIECTSSFQYDINNDDITITSTCGASSIDFSPDNAVSANAGDAALNLGLSANLGMQITSLVENISSSDPNSSLAGTNAGNCVNFGGNITDFDEYDFQVNTTGIYTFAIAAPWGLVMNIYEDSYNPANPCSNWINSSFDNGSGIGSTVDATLNTGTQYVMVVSSFSASTPSTLPANYTVTLAMSSAGNIYDGPPPPPASFSYTYVIVNQTTNNIIGFQANSDLTAYSTGDYKVYGLNYENSSNLTPYIGGSFTTLQDDLVNLTVCGLISSNCKSVMISGTCPSLSATPTALSIGSESSCMSSCTVGGGSWALSGTPCPSGSSLQSFGTAGATSGGSAMTMAPAYDQNNAQTFHVRCVCDSDMTMVSPVQTISSTPGVCTNPATPTLLIAQNSCPTTANGSIVATGSGGTLKYYTGPNAAAANNNALSDISGSMSPPAYQAHPTIVYLCVVVVDTDGCRSTPACGQTAPIDCSCPSNVPLSGTVSGVVDTEASNSITSNQHITGASAQVDYDAGNYILLTSGFTVDAMAVFHAFIDGCGGSMADDDHEVDNNE